MAEDKDEQQKTRRNSKRQGCIPDEEEGQSKTRRIGEDQGEK
jgi:hypothetical protein